MAVTKVKVRTEPIPIRPITLRRVYVPVVITKEMISASLDADGSAFRKFPPTSGEK